MQTAKRALEELKTGNQRFIKGESEFSSAANLNKLKNFAENGQTPKAIILCCSDARAPVEMIFDQQLGDLFVIRVAGNIIAPSLVGSIEYAAEKFGVKLVVIMGHTQCGAIKATIEHLDSVQNTITENILDIIGRIKPHVRHIARLKETRQEKCFKATFENVRASVSELRHSSKMLEELVINKKIHIVGSIFHLETGVVEFLDT